MEFRSIHTLKTAENVQLHVELAGLANRVFAFAVDFCIMGLLMGLSTLFFSMANFTQTAPELFKTLSPLILFILFFGYHLFQEWLWNGRTVGKAFFKIRVVRNNGQPIGFWEAFGRNLFRVVDVYLSGIGLLCMMFNRSEKRFGDWIAGTIVINDHPLSKPVRPTSDLSGVLETGPDSASQQHNAPDTMPHITHEERELLMAFFQRKNKLFTESRTQLQQALCQYFSERLHATITTEADLEALIS